MNSIVEDVYEKRKKDLTFEIYFIEGIQYNFKLEDMEKLLDINSKEDLEIFKKYLYYLDVYRVNYPYSNSFEETINQFESILDEDEKTKEKLKLLFIKHENLFSDSDGMKKLKNIPKEYNNRIFQN